MTWNAAQLRDPLEYRGVTNFLSCPGASGTGATPSGRPFAEPLGALLKDDYPCLYNVPVGLWQQHPDFLMLQTTFHFAYPVMWTWVVRKSGRSPAKLGPSALCELLREAPDQLPDHRRLRRTVALPRPRS